MAPRFGKRGGEEAGGIFEIKAFARGKPAIAFDAPVPEEGRDLRFSA
jgi:hypothetical protein